MMRVLCICEGGYTCVGVGALAHMELYRYLNSGLSSYITRTIAYAQSSQSSLFKHISKLWIAWFDTISVCYKYLSDLNKL